MHRTCGSMNCTFAGRLNFDDKLLQPCRFIMRITWKKAEIGSTFVPTTIATKRLVSTHAIAEYHNESAIAQMSHSLTHSLTRPTLGGLECRVKHRSYLELNKFSSDSSHSDRTQFVLRSWRSSNSLKFGAAKSAK